jgi:hypothetical protein
MMKVRLVRENLEGCPPKLAGILQLSKTTGLTLGKTYEVYGISVFKGVPGYKLIPDNSEPFLDYPSGYASWHFDVVDASCPSDWVCAINNSVDVDIDGSLSMVVGPAIMASTIAAWVDLAELAPGAVKAFWKYVQTQKSSDLVHIPKPDEGV